jgi:hypothetical protein
MFFEEFPLRRPAEIDGQAILSDAPDEHPGGIADQTNEPAPDGTPEELLTVDAIQRRAARPRPLIPKPEPEPEWIVQIREQMQKRISFDFVDTPLADVVAFLSNLTNTNIVLDPAAVDGDDVPVTLKVSDMKLEAAMEWILRLVNLSYAFHSEAIFIATVDRLQDLPSQRNMQITYRAFDLREQLKEDSREVLLELIRNSIAADWEAPEAILSFIDGRLIIRHRRIVVRMVEEMMDEFLRASGVEPPEKLSPKTGALKLKVIPRVKAAMERELPLNGAVELNRARNLIPNIGSLDSFWANYFGSVKRGNFAWARRLCAVDGLTNIWPEAEKEVLSKAELERLISDVDVFETNLKRAENGLRMKQMVEFRGMPATLIRIEGGLLYLRAGNAEFGVRMAQIKPEQLWHAFEAAYHLERLQPARQDQPLRVLPGFTSGGGIIVSDGGQALGQGLSRRFDHFRKLGYLRDKTSFQILLGSPEKALAQIDEAKEAKLDFEIYRPYLKRRFEAFQRARSLPKSSSCE